MRGEQKVQGGSLASHALGAVTRVLPDSAKAFLNKAISVPISR
jgi:uncharacterized protein